MEDPAAPNAAVEEAMLAIRNKHIHPGGADAFNLRPDNGLGADGHPIVAGISTAYDPKLISLLARHPIVIAAARRSVFLLLAAKLARQAAYDYALIDRLHPADVTTALVMGMFSSSYHPLERYGLFGPANAPGPLRRAACAATSVVFPTMGRLGRAKGVHGGGLQVLAATGVTLSTDVRHRHPMPILPGGSTLETRPSAAGEPVRALGRIAAKHNVAAGTPFRPWDDAGGESDEEDPETMAQALGVDLDDEGRLVFDAADVEEGAGAADFMEAARFALRDVVGLRGEEAGSDRGGDGDGGGGGGGGRGPGPGGRGGELDAVREEAERRLRQIEAGRTHRAQLVADAQARAQVEALHFDAGLPDGVDAVLSVPAGAHDHIVAAAEARGALNLAHPAIAHFAEAVIAAAGNSPVKLRFCLDLILKSLRAARADAAGAEQLGLPGRVVAAAGGASAGFDQAVCRARLDAGLCASGGLILDKVVEAVVAAGAALTVGEAAAAAAADAAPDGTACVLRGGAIVFASLHNSAAAARDGGSVDVANAIAFSGTCLDGLLIFLSVGDVMDAGTNFNNFLGLRAAVGRMVLARAPPGGVLQDPEEEGGGGDGEDGGGGGQAAGAEEEAAVAAAANLALARAAAAGGPVQEEGAPAMRERRAAAEAEAATAAAVGALAGRGLDVAHGPVLSPTNPRRILIPPVARRALEDQASLGALDFLRTGRRVAVVTARRSFGGGSDAPVDGETASSRAQNALTLCLVGLIKEKMATPPPGYDPVDLEIVVYQECESVSLPYLSTTDQVDEKFGGRGFTAFMERLGELLRRREMGVDLAAVGAVGVSDERFGRHHQILARQIEHARTHGYRPYSMFADPLMVELVEAGFGLPAGITTEEEAWGYRSRPAFKAAMPHLAGIGILAGSSATPMLHCLTEPVFDAMASMTGRLGCLAVDRLRHTMGTPASPAVEAKRSALRPSFGAAAEEKCRTTRDARGGVALQAAAEAVQRLAVRDRAAVFPGASHLGGTPRTAAATYATPTEDDRRIRTVLRRLQQWQAGLQAKGLWRADGSLPSLAEEIPARRIQYDEGGAPSGGRAGFPAGSIRFGERLFLPRERGRAYSRAVAAARAAAPPGADSYTWMAPSVWLASTVAAVNLRDVPVPEFWVMLQPGEIFLVQEDGTTRIITTATREAVPPGPVVSNIAEGRRTLVDAVEEGERLPVMLAAPTFHRVVAGRPAYDLGEMLAYGALEMDPRGVEDAPAFPLAVPGLTLETADAWMGAGGGRRTGVGDERGGQRPGQRGRGGR